MGFVARHRRNQNRRKSAFNVEQWRFLVDADFNVSERCCDIMKKRPFHDYVKETGRRPITGTMADESLSRRTNWYQHGCNAFDGKDPISAPLSFWTEQDIIQYIHDYNIPYCSVYGDIVETENGF